MKRWLGLCLVLGIWLFSLMGCTTEPVELPATATPTKSFVIGMSLSDLSHFFTTLKEAAEETASGAGATILVENAANDMAQQELHIQSFIEQKVDAILINPVDSDAVVTSIEAAVNAGIPVFTVDRSANTDLIITHIASDNKTGGEMAGSYLAEILGREGNVVELQGIPGTSAAIDRGQGFDDIMGDYSEIHIIVRQNADFNRAQAKELFAQILTEQDDIDGVFAHNDEMILGAIQAAQEIGRDKDIVFIGFDAVPDAVAAVEAGDLQATIAQQSAEMGRLSIETILKYLNGTPVADFIAVDLALIIQ